ncbi:hypothetical protein N9L31_00085 [bacterium]|nr:hypothetical protein [bacterium]
MRLFDALAGRFVFLFIIDCTIRQAVHLWSQTDVLADRHAVGLVFELPNHLLVRLVIEVLGGWVVEVAHVVEAPVGLHVLVEVVGPNVIAQRVGVGEHNAAAAARHDKN